MDFVRDYMRALLAKEIDAAAELQKQKSQVFISSIAQAVRYIVATIAQA